MYLITKEFDFCASHNLVGLRDGHPCLRTHGHNYKVIIECQAEQLSTEGFVLDYREMQVIKEKLDMKYDHKHLNDIMDGQPSAERIAYQLFQEFKSVIPYLSAVTVSETPKTYATYRP